MLRVLLTYRGYSIELGPGETIVGRGLDCRVRFNDAAVSRHHTRFFVEGSKVTVEDLGSTNGTSVNGEKLSGVRLLENHDEIAIGRRKLEVRLMHVDEDGEPVDEHTVDEATITRNSAWGGGSNSEEQISDDDNATPVNLLKDLAFPTYGQLNCPHCGKSVSAEAEHCTHCGTKFPPGRPMSITQRIQFKAIDRRQEVRCNVEVPVLYSSENLTFEAVARDLSHGGMFIATELLDPIGTSCKITVLPDGRPAVCFAGIVCHVVETETGAGGRPPGIGIRFSMMGKDAETWLKEALENAVPGSGFMPT